MEVCTIISQSNKFLSMLKVGHQCTNKYPNVFLPSEELLKDEENEKPFKFSKSIWYPLIFPTEIKEPSLHIKFVLCYRDSGCLFILFYLLLLLFLFMLSTQRTIISVSACYWSATNNPHQYIYCSKWLTAFILYKAPLCEQNEKLSFMFRYLALQSDNRQLYRKNGRENRTCSNHTTRTTRGIFLIYSLLFLFQQS